MAAPQASVDAVRLGLDIPDDRSAAFTDDLIAGFLESHPVNDPLKHQPSEMAWVPSYDVMAATADLWGLIAVSLSSLYDFQADTAVFTRSQMFENAMKMQRYFNSRRHARSCSVSRDRQLDILYQGRWPFAADRDINTYEQVENEIYPAGTTQGTAL